uniref:hypothetical protein n=1 Tax=Cupriavidus necator TaxID=106590 RepID=UPI003F49460C
MRVQQPREHRLLAGRPVRRHRAQPPALPVLDMLRLIVNSKLPSAERFERWVFE